MILYNEIDSFAAAWTEELISRNHVAPGRVERKSIVEIEPEELDGATQFHAFAGIAVWSHALRLAGWPDDREVWTGSCPCQPYSVAGKGEGEEDERHLWPEWFRLIDGRRPRVVLGEQVASVPVVGKVSARPDKKTDDESRRAWIDTVRIDLEGIGYAVAFSVLPAASVGAPHIRYRVFFAAIQMADSDQAGQRKLGSGGVRENGDASHGHNADGRSEDERLANPNSITGGQGSALVGRSDPRGDATEGTGPRSGSEPVGLADTSELGWLGRGSSEASDGRDETRLEPERLRDAGGLGNADSGRTGRNSGAGNSEQSRLEGQSGNGNGSGEPGRDIPDPNGPTPTSGLWSNPEWVYCRDGKYRPVEPGSPPLVAGATNRVGRLRGYGNAINAEVAATFIRAVMEAA